MDNDIRKAKVLEALKNVRDPDLGRDIVSLGFIKNLEVDGESASFTLELTTPACPVRDQMKEEARRVVFALPGFKNVDIQMTAQVRPTESEQKKKLVPLVKNIIPVASGKGGVGKSTVSANLAIALTRLGARVGLMDADVYGPSIPTIMGAKKQPGQKDGRIMVPPVEHGVAVMSMGFFIPVGKAVIWRGPMLHKAVEQFLGQVEWGDLDYLIVDLPPGTGDVQLTLCQMIPLTGAAIVSTPQDVALNVAEKAIIMFDQLRTPILGLIENMSSSVCSACGHREEIFGSGGVRRYSLQKGLPFLGEIPLSTAIRTTSDEGAPIVSSFPDSPAAKAFFKVAENLAAQVSIQNIGDLPGNRPEPAEITPLGIQIRIVWKDRHESIYTGHQLRQACMCAHCVSETTGQPFLSPYSASRDIHPLAINPVGRYAIQIEWSDGHATGIYTFERLRDLCPCPSCERSKAETKGDAAA